MQDARKVPTKVWSEGPIDTTEVLVKAMLEQQNRLEPNNPVNSNFNLIMKQISQLKHENRELKQMMQYKSLTPQSPHSNASN